MNTHRARALAVAAIIAAGIVLSTLTAPSASAGISTSPVAPPRPPVPVSPLPIGITLFLGAA